MEVDMRRPRFVVLLIAALFATASLATSARAVTGAPDAAVSIASKSIAFGIGSSWGYGKLRFRGEEFVFSVDGVTFLDWGFSQSNAAGEVYNLSDLKNFNGTYFAVEASFAFGGGLGSATLRNQNGVVIRLDSVSSGARLQLGSSGIKIRLRCRLACGGAISALNSSVADSPRQDFETMPAMAALERINIDDAKQTFLESFTDAVAYIAYRAARANDARIVPRAACTWCRCGTVFSVIFHAVENIFSIELRVLVCSGRTAAACFPIVTT